MYSISSQLFEGLTEYILRTENETIKEEESQKGPVGSGRVLAEIIEKNTNETEKKFLHDYSYNLFEDTLKNEKRVLELNASNINEEIEKISDYSFVKISGNVIFNDLKIIEDTMKNYNKIGAAFGYFTHRNTINEDIEKLNTSINNIKDRNQKAKAKATIKPNIYFNKLLKEHGLHLEQDFLDHFVYILNFGYNQQFEVQLPVKSSTDEFYLFSAQLKRENLKDDELSIIKKYSRETEKEFKLFGIITQRLTEKSKRNLFEDIKAYQENINQPNLKETLMDMMSKLTKLEASFIGKMNYEYVIDPIALYLEI
jgi:hypothetical protein